MRIRNKRPAFLIGMTILACLLASPNAAWSKLGMNGLPDEVHWLAGFADRSAAQSGIVSNVGAGVNLRASGLLVTTDIPAIHSGGIRVTLNRQSFEAKAMMAFPSARIAAFALDLEGELPVPKFVEPVQGEKVTIIGSSAGRFAPMITRGLVSQVSTVENGGAFYVDTAKAGRVADGVVMSGDRVIGIVTHEGLRVRCLSMPAIEKLVSRWQEKPIEASP